MITVINLCQKFSYHLNRVIGNLFLNFSNNQYISYLENSEMHRNANPKCNTI